jgi:hypothetical protein
VARHQRSRRVVPALVAALLLSPAPATARTVRLFAVGHKQRLADAVTYQSFRDKMFALMDARRPGRAALVEAGLDDVASHVQPADPGAPALVLANFPEDTGLIAGLIGSRGATARGRTTSAAAILELANGYAPLLVHYRARFGTRHPVGDLFVAATDTFYRAFYETFRDLATTYAIHVTVSANVAPARRVAEADDPDLVALLRDPDEPGRAYAYEAVSNLVRNAVFVFGPDGEVLVPQPDGSTLRSPSETGGVILPSVTKAYLTPLELDLIGLVATPVRDMDVVDTPAGRIGVVISKDAWMVDVNDRFEAKGAHLLLQSEAFSEWAFPSGDWAPDVYREGGFAHLQKHPSFRVNVGPSLTGNLFDITFDGQTTILGKKVKADPGPLSAMNAWVGQNPDTAFLRVAPWVIDDPGIADPGLSLAERRNVLVATGRALLPGTGIACPTDLTPGACENGYREAVIHADVELPDGGDVLVPPDPGPRVETAFGASVRVNGPDGASPSRQKNARVAARGRRVLVVWEDSRFGLPTICLSVSRNGGASFGPAVKVSDNAAGTVAERLPDIALAGDGAVVVWQEFVTGEDDDRGRVRLARFTLRGRKRRHDVQVDDGGDAAGVWRPAVAAAGRHVHVAWVDERDPAPDGRVFEHVYFARSADGGRRFEPARRLDAGVPVALSATLDNKWAPAVAATGATVAVAWTDFRNYNWDVFAATSTDRGATFGPNVRVDDFAPPVERLHGAPAVALVPRPARVVVAWTDLRAREPDPNVFYATSLDAGATFSANTQLDRSRDGFRPDTDTPSDQWAPRLAADRGDVCAAWQDDRLGNNDVFFAASRDGGASFGPDERVDDTGGGPSDQYNPAVAATRRRGRLVCHVVWEDTRDGDSDVFAARRVLR